MPSPLYNNATLAEQERKRKLGVSFDPSQDTPAAVPANPFPAEPSIDELLAAAKATLGNADALSNARDQGAAGGYDFSPADASAVGQGGLVRPDLLSTPYNKDPNAGSVFDSPVQSAWSGTKRLYGKVQPALDALAAAGLLTGVGTAPATAYFGANAMGDLANKDLGTDPVGTGMDVLQLLPALGSLGKLGKAAGAASDAADYAKSVAPRYPMSQVLGRGAGVSDLSAPPQSAQAIKDVIGGADPSSAVRAEAGIPKGGFLKKAGYTAQDALEKLKSAISEPVRRQDALRSIDYSRAPEVFQWPKDMGRNQEIFKDMARKGTFGAPSTDWVNQLDATGGAQPDFNINDQMQRIADEWARFGSQYLRGR